MTDSPHGTGRRHTRPDPPTGGEGWLRDPSPATLASVAIGIVVVVLVGTLSFFAMPRRPDLPPPVGGEAILASPPTADLPTESYSPAPVSLSTRAALPTRSPAPPRRTTPAARPPAPKPSASRTKPPVSRPGELIPLPASRESTLRSSGGGPETFVDFVNARTAPVVVHWLNYDGRRQRYAVLQVGQSYRQQTYVGHPWVVTDEQRRPLVCFEPARQTLRAVIR
ncbi:VHL beta domain-containing protein [Micromonospora schwarzwaldensis]|uniref:VHL beta domain-containing protein n=1 Tax=Micromonospora sp. DSM 45708 TaxID=3111767 RepID=UPI0031DE7BAF